MASTFQRIDSTPRVRAHLPGVLAGLAFVAVPLGACGFPSYEFVDGLAMVCTDGRTSDAETGVDCGGGCPPCPMGETCREHDDCASDSCQDGVCQQPSCTDRVKNGTEADVDCGGPCEACRPGRDCMLATDCAEGVCGDGFCQVAACDDRTHNGDETDVDCGGACPTRCPNRAGCVSNADCDSAQCVASVCVAPSCTDGVLNGGELALDCGSPGCAPCQPGSPCSANEQCQSGVCELEVCTTWGCKDGVKNGRESDIDCGGAICAGCDTLGKCGGPSDCASSLCVSTQCVPMAPTGALLARDGWTAHASHNYPDAVASQVLDSVGYRWSSGAEQVDGMWFEVDMGKPQAFFSVQFLSNQAPTDFPAKYDLYVSSDGKYGAPAQSGLFGDVISKARFDTAQLARYIKVVLRQNKSKWWSMDELQVLQ